MIALHHGDCRNVLPTLGLVADAVVTDPPYDLVAMTKRFGNGTPARSPDHQRFARGFMGQQWDGEGIAFDPETWRGIAAALRPGGFLVAFGGTRTYHRLTCAIEDAGFIIQDCLMWLYGTGFPKRRDALKPAFEPIILAYKPGGKRTLQVDECRVPSEPIHTTRNIGIWGQAKIPGIFASHSNGRWPANLCHDGSDEVVGLFPENRPGGGNINISGDADHSSRIYGKGLDTQPREAMGDSGSAARFFFSAKAGAQDRWGSRHPTVKPVELMKWLVALVTPPGGTCLDPFAGSGTTAVAALAAGRSAILIEREDQYVADIRERLAFYEGGGTHSVQAKNRNHAIDHGPLFAAKLLTAEEDVADSLASYNAAVMAVGERVRAGEPVPEFMLSRRRPLPS